MTDLLERVTAALAPRYEVRREIGRGGMATVFLAGDTTTGAEVALKVFRPEIAMALGAERFLREIDVAARMSHPHIVPLLDSGSTGAVHGEPILWYSMPWIPGESLAGRIEREGELPLDEVVAIVTAVAAALEHAHERGIVHRDVKPANILLAPAGPLVADFGIAHAIGQTGEQKLTSTGAVVGTAAYMSPEQAGGSGRLDGRSDIYALGCVAYEMLVSEPPFSGPTTQAIMARHAVGEVPSLRVVRPGIPPSVEAAVRKALAKSPADRYRTAGEFAAALASAVAGGGGTLEIPRATPRRRIGLIAALVIAIGAAMLAVRPWSLVRRGPAAAADATRIAVLPFTLAAGADSGAAALAAGLADLVVQRLPGGDGPRAVRAAGTNADPAAARVLQGAVWSSGASVVLSATLADGTTGEPVARVERVAGPRDSVPALVDRLVSLVLVRGSGLPAGHAAALESLPLAPAREFLGAREAFRDGRYADAIEKFAGVLAADSTAYPAALGLALAGEIHDSRVTGDAVRLARVSGHRLDRADSLLVHALDWNGPGRSSSSAERLEGFENATNAAPERAELWFVLGERLFHDGPLLGQADVLERSAQSFRRAVELEPAFAPALGHLIDLAAGLGDTAAVRELAPRYRTAAGHGALAGYYDWRIAVALGDSAALRAARAGFDSLGAAALERIVNVVQLDGLDPADARSAARALWERSGVRVESRWAFMKQREIALNGGRPREAATLFERQRAAVGLRARDGLAEVVNALEWGADSAPAAAWVASVAARVDAVDARDPGADDNIHYERCGAGLWRAALGDHTGALRARTRLLAWEPEVFEPFCAQIIAAVVAAATGAPGADAELARLDSAAASAPSTITWLLVSANLNAARLWEARGEPGRALAAVRRRPYIVDIGEPRVLVALSTMLAEEARLAEVTGDRAGAARAQARLAALRRDAER